MRIGETRDHLKCIPAIWFVSTDLAPMSIFLPSVGPKQFSERNFSGLCTGGWYSGSGPTNQHMSESNWWFGCDLTDEFNVSILPLLRETKLRHRRCSRETHFRQQVSRSISSISCSISRGFNIVIPSNTIDVQWTDTLCSLSKDTVDIWWWQLAIRIISLQKM